MIERLPLLAWPRGRKSLLTTLIYHRVLAQPEPLRPGEVDAATFARQMAFLARNFQALPLPEAVHLLREDRLPRRAVCVTFDDGYADNLTVALPILEHYRLPATVFVATGYLNGGRMFSDSVVEIVARSRSASLDFRQLGLDEYRIDTVEAQRSTVAALQGHLKYLPPAERDARVVPMAEAATCGPLPTDLMLTTEQLVELSRRNVEIGGHTHTHTILNTLDDDQARAEITQGKTLLESITGKPVRTFAYPNGRPERDYSARHAAMMSGLGFEAAVTTAHGVATSATDAYQLPRFTPWGRSTTLLGARITRNAMLRQPAAVCERSVTGQA